MSFSIFVVLAVSRLTFIYNRKKMILMQFFFVFLIVPLNQCKKKIGQTINQLHSYPTKKNRKCCPFIITTSKKASITNTSYCTNSTITIESRPDFNIDQIRSRFSMHLYLLVCLCVKQKKFLWIVILRRPKS